MIGARHPYIPPTSQGKMTVILRLLAALCFFVATANSQQCTHASANGVDYADANVTVVPGATEDDCCKACASWNQLNTDPAKKCTIVVWYNTAPKSCGIKATMDRPVKGVRVAALLAPPTLPGFRFSNVYGGGMVLQAAPSRAQLWGFTPGETDKVSVQLDGGVPIDATVTAGVDSAGR